MIVYPAIDIRGGKAVRLVEGDFARETTFEDDPAAAARRWASLGAAWIHVVDLDAARDGVRRNGNAIGRIRDTVSTRLQLGGGIRSLDDVNAAFTLGVDRIVIGSAALTDPDLVPAAVDAYGEAIAVGLDTRDGKVATHGWIDQTDVEVWPLAERFGATGLSTVIFTDIRRDGRLAGPNLDALARMIACFDGDVVASGGIGSLDDLAAVKRTGAAGAIVGSALYHGRIDLRDALRTAREAPSGAPA